ncbi:MAG TPA: M20 family metallopeptidase [Candidatus Saccharimonadales bacterium]|nr:M20 family metallopeptidase [Candidatus Saccharimonadales bacterium]
MQTELEAILSQLVSIPSVSSNSAACHEIIEFVRGYLHPLSLHITSDTDRESPWLIATTQATKEPDIMLVAHLDVVPAEAEDFAVTNRDGKLYGRGVYDMKVAAACYLTLFKHHIAELRSHNVGIMFTTDEEVNSACMPPILEAGWRPKLAFIPDGGDNWHVEERAKGLYGIEIIARGQTAHGSRPWEGTNALHHLMDVLSVLRKRFPHQHPDSSTLAVNHIAGGNAINQIADYAAAKVDFRSFSREDLRIFRDEVARLSAEYNLEVTPIQEGDPLLFDKTSPEAQGFLRALEKITGKTPQYTSSFGASDARYFAQYDIPCIVMEPRGGGRHSKQEWLLASDLERYYRLIQLWILGDHPAKRGRHASTLHKTTAL